MCNTRAMTNYLSVAEVARRLGVNVSTVHRRIKSGTMTPVAYVGPQPLFTADAITVAPKVGVRDAAAGVEVPVPCHRTPEPGGGGGVSSLGQHPVGQMVRNLGLVSGQGLDDRLEVSFRCRGSRADVQRLLVDYIPAAVNELIDLARQPPKNPMPQQAASALTLMDLYGEVHE